MSMDDLDGRKALFQASGLKGGRVLDVGMGGCGCMSLFLAKRGFDVIGIDHSTRAIHEARKNLCKKRMKGTFVARLANAENLPFKDNEFDAVIAYHSLHHVDNVKKVVNEMFRVCGKNGLILISELNDNGRKAYEHECDHCRLLIEKVDKLTVKRARSRRKTRTKNNIIFICKK